MVRRDWLAAALLAAALATAIFAIGGATRWAQALTAAVAALALVPTFTSRRVIESRSPLVVLLGLALVLTAIQLVPLPAGLIETVDPVGAALREQGGALVGISPSSTLSLDVPGTLRAVAFFTILLAIAVVSVRLASSEGGRYRVLATVASLCGLTALISGIHELVGAHRLYGLYVPVQANPQLVGPLLSGNHMGCLMAIGAVIALGLTTYRRQRSWLRAAWLIVAAACAAAALATLSRGAALGLAAGTFVLIGVIVAQRVLVQDAPRRRRGSFFTSSLPIGVVGVCAVIVVIYASAGGVADQLTRTQIDEINAPRSKFAAWRSAATLIEESPWVGVGRGAFEPAFTRVHAASAYATYSHVENEYVQAVVDWGIPGACLLAIATGWFLLVAARRWRDGPLAGAALGALTVVLLQSNVDFGIELLGVAAPITAVAATLAYVPLREGTTRQRGIARAIRGVHLLALTGAAALLLSSATTTVEEDHAAIAHDPTITLARLRTSIERHPLDYYSYALAAAVMQRDGDRDAIRVLGHALALHPTHPSLHLTAARLLYNSGFVKQAAVEYAAALPATRDKPKLLAEIAARFDVATAASAIPVETGPFAAVTQMLDDLGRGDLAAAWVDHVLAMHPELVQGCDVLYAMAARHGNLPLLVRAQQRCTTYQPTQEVRLQMARVYASHDDPTHVLSLLSDVESWRGRRDEKQMAWLAVCDAYIALSRWDDAKRCLHHLDASGLVPRQRASEINGRLDRIDKAMADAGRGSASLPAHLPPNLHIEKAP